MSILSGGRWLLLGQELVSATDGTLIKNLADSLAPFGGPATGTSIALATVLRPEQNFLSPMRLQGYDLSADTGWGNYVPHLQSGEELGPVYFALLHGDKVRVLAIAVLLRSQTAWFVVGDLTTGQTSLQKELSYPFGEIALSESGETVVVSDPSRTLIFDSQPTLDVFDLPSRAHLKRFTIASEKTGGPIYPGQLAWVPESNEVVTAPPGDFNSIGGMAVVDVKSLSVIRLLYLPTSNYFTGGMTVGWEKERVNNHSR
ncbi:MAG: hypothetical protein HY304_01280 [candidate division Zixibacteria bacterium]|nr:hypothetical protein [candidate division Zixibacteria bacterium]